MAQSNSTTGWSNHRGHLNQQWVNYIENQGSAPPPPPPPLMDSSRHQIDFRLGTSSPGSTYRQEGRGVVASPIVLPSISQLSEMAPLDDFSFTSGYRPGYQMVTRDGLGHGQGHGHVPMVQSAPGPGPGPGRFSGFAGQMQVGSRSQGVQGNRGELYHDMRDGSLRLPELNLNFTLGRSSLDNRAMLIPEHSSATTQISQSQPDYSDSLQGYHQPNPSPQQPSDPSDPSNPYPYPYPSTDPYLYTSKDPYPYPYPYPSTDPSTDPDQDPDLDPGAPPQRPVIVRHNIHTHQCDRCPSKFTRAGELKRHYKMHQPERRMFHCWIAGCDRNGEKGFYRSDKFRDHQRKAHRCGKMLGNRGVEGGGGGGGGGLSHLEVRQ